MGLRAACPRPSSSLGQGEQGHEAGRWGCGLLVPIQIAAGGKGSKGVMQGVGAVGRLFQAMHASAL